MKIMAICAVLFGAAVLMEWLRRQHSQLQPGERLARLRRLTNPEPSRRGSATRELANRVATSLGETSRLYRFKIRLDDNRRGA